jgi:FMN-dependent NADH-azoreductase
MEHILFINACVRPESRTYMLAQSVLSHLEGEVRFLHLNDEKLPHLDEKTLRRRDELLAKGDFDHPMLGYAHQFAQADTIVIAAPYWDLMFPALLKSYLEAITVSGVTFKYNEGAPYSLCKAKRLVYVTTAGGFIGEYDFGFRYVEALARGFFGIEKLLCVKAEGLDIIGANVPAILVDAQNEAARALENF